MKKIKKIACLALSLLLCVASVPMQMTSFAEEEYCPFSGGTGAENNPYQISTAYDLRLLSELVNDPETNPNYRYCYYIQTNNIDLKNVDFTPIGLYHYAETKYVFAGNYNGNYHSIYNFYTTSSNNYCGLFGRIGQYDYDNSKSVIQNLSVFGKIDRSDSAEGICGGIVGEVAYGGSILNCTFNGEIFSNGYVGAIAGSSWCGSTITSCYSNSNLNLGNLNTDSVVGGLVGKVVTGVNTVKGSGNFSLDNSYYIGKIHANNDYSFGGIVGRIEKQTALDTNILFKSCYYLDSSCNGSVNGKDYNGCQSMDSDFMKNIDELLEKPFVHNDSSELNDGYPVFEWQSIPYQFKGSGTAEDPYQISSKEELEKMRDLVNSPFFGWKYNKEHYIQTADIDLKNELWTPIGKRMANGVDLSVPMFEGNYNGNYHTIKNLFVNETNRNSYSGLFGSLHGKYNIENLIVYGEVKSNGGCVGGIVGEVVNEGGTVKNCAFIGNVCGHNAVGGIAGVVFQNGSVDSCYHVGKVSAIEENSTSIGGIAGRVFAGDHYEGVSIVKNCYNIGEVTGSDGQTGSIAGTMELRDNVHGEVYVSNCYSIKGEASTNANGNYNSYDVKELSDNMMKNDVVRKLGSPFIKNSNSDFNSGYPVFWWQLSGDVNADGKLSVTDVIAVQKWIHKQGSLKNWQNVDFNGDGKVNVVDLCLMKKLLLSR